MDITAIATLISALAAAVTAWIEYRKYHDNRTPRHPSPSTPAPTQYQPSQTRQTGFLSSKVTRRSVLLGSTTLGLVLIFATVATQEIQLFFVGNGIILVCGICVWKVRVQEIAAWRRAILNFGGVIGAANMVVLLLWFAWGGEGMVNADDWIELIYVWFFSLIVYVMSIYTGCW